ncbi:hypothetical protein X742_20960 [Mesorhizobium sp. LNHC232B00]|nr:hypothetical protein X742_20960 [Mesorhizobium sp. LNHC232B00]
MAILPEVETGVAHCQRARTVGAERVGCHHALQGMPDERTTRPGQSGPGSGHKDWKMLRRYTHLKPEMLHTIQGARAA